MTTHRLGAGLSEVALVGLLVILWAACCLLIILRDAYRGLVRSARQECDDLRQDIRAAKEREAHRRAGEDFVTTEFYEEVLHQHWWQDRGRGDR